PKKLFLISGNQLEINYLNFVADEMDEDFQAIINLEINEHLPVHSKPEIKARISKPDYVKKVTKMLHHIQMGNIYEANFCQEFFAENALIHPLHTYLKLNVISSPPFAVFLKMTDLFLMSASPERFVRKQGKKIISQPIK